MARPFKICPDCGAHLDASEPCDCKDAIEREPPKPWERLKLLAVCREVDKESGRVSVYPLDLEITSEILASLKMRAQFNPELRYFTTTTARWDRYGEVKTLGDEAYTDRLMKLNPQYRRTFVFPAGITLTIPEPETRVSSDLPPWKRGTAE